MAGFRIEGNTSGNVVEVNSSNEMKVVLSNVPANIGGVRNFAEVDAGDILGVPTLKSAEITPDYRMRVGTDSLLFNDTFNGTTQNTSLWKYTNSTMTIGMSSGFVNLNTAGTAAASGSYSYLQTWRHFPLVGNAPISTYFTFMTDRYPVANEVIQAGFGIPTGAAECVDGIWFELTSDGLKGCQRYNSGTVQKVTLMLAASLTLNNVYNIAIDITDGVIQWWIDDILYGIQETPAAQQQPFLMTSLPFFMQKYNSGTVGSSPNIIPKFGEVAIYLANVASNKTWAEQMVTTGLSNQYINGSASTVTTPAIQWSNTALPTAAAGTNTTAALGAFLGGIFQLNTLATSATDVIISSYLNPAGSVNITPRTMVITGIRVDCINAGAAVATTPTTFAVALAWGGTALTLAQVETANTWTGPTVKARRVQPIGVMTFPIGAAIGAISNTIDFSFASPIVVNPAEYVQVIVKPIIATATASEVYQFVISPNFYQE